MPKKTKFATLWKLAKTIPDTGNGIENKRAWEKILAKHGWTTREWYEAVRDKT